MGEPEAQHPREVEAGSGDGEPLGRTTHLAVRKDRPPRDAAELTSDEDALDRAEERYQSMLDSLPDGVFLLDGSSGTTIEANATLCHFLGMRLEQILGRPLVDWLPVDDLTLVDGAVSRALRGRRVVPFEVTLRGLGGTERHVEMHFAPIESGRVRGLIRDATERHQAEAEKRELQKLLRRAQKLETIGTLAGGIAHDMNNVLASISGIASAMEKELDEEHALRQDVAAILSATRSGRDLTLNLLGFARRDKSSLRLFDVLQSATNVERILRRTIPKSVQIRLRTTCDTALVQGDPGQIEQAVMNLCVNAVDAMGGHGRLEIGIDIVTIDPGDVSVPPGPYVRLRVTDTGEGMDQTTARCAFEPFFTTKPRGEGTGLGLAMVYNTIRAHCGHVRLESQSGVGTTVTLLLPQAKDKPSVLPMVEAEAVDEPVGPLKVLLIDDEALVRRATQRMLAQMGHRVTLAASGQEGLETYAESKEPFDVVFLDLAMPGMDGSEVLVKLRTIDPSVRVVLLSGLSRQEQAPEMRKLGAMHFLQKPFERRDLSHALCRALRARESADKR
jgi:two-component system cell cycle sensor histidine kinase/response regulator CckA